MEDKQILLQLNDDGTVSEYKQPYITMDFPTEGDYNLFKNILSEYNQATKPLPLENWHEDQGDCLWWKFPIEEPPYLGTPLDNDFPNYVTHYTKIILPKL